MSIIYKENSHAYHHLKQADKQSFPAFYTDFVRYSERGHVVSEDLKVWDLENRLKKELRKSLAGCWKKEPWTVPELKVYLTRLDQSQRIAAKRLEEAKAQAFAAQYARARAEAEAKRRRSSQRIKILTRSDSGYESGEGLTDYWR